MFQHENGFARRWLSAAGEAGLDLEAEAHEWVIVGKDAFKQLLIFRPELTVLAGLGMGVMLGWLIKRR